MSTPPNVTQANCAFPNVQSFNWGTNVRFVSCVGSFEGNVNDNMQSIQQLTSAWGGVWDSLGSTDAGKIGNPFHSFTTAPVGTLYFMAPMNGRFVLAIKSANSYTYYLLETTSPIASVNYTTLGTSLNKQGIAQDISHVNLFVPSSTPPQTTVPEPMTFALMALGLLSVFMFRKMFRKKV